MKTILVVDDSKTIRMIMKHLISSNLKDVSVLSFDSGEEVLKDLPEISKKIHIAFIDYNMAGMNGVELAQLLIESGVKPESIYLVTANVQNALKEKARGFNIHFIEKPMTVEKIQTILTSHAPGTQV